MSNEYPFDYCPDCKEEIREGSLRWNGETWEHKSRSNHSQAGHHRIELFRDCKSCGGIHCPTCEECFKSKLGVKQHHKRTHGRSLTKITVFCDREECDETKKLHKSEIRNRERIFCSDECKNIVQSREMLGEGNYNWNGGDVEVVCDYCGKKFETNPYNKNKCERNFCSYKCMGDWRSENWSGEDSPHWKGGYPYYRGSNWQEMRRKTLERDDHRCKVCGSEEELHVHHLTPILTYNEPEQANKLSNLVVLCPEHHFEAERGDIQFKVEGDGVEAIS